MSNPWAKSFEELRSPYLLEKKAKKDYDGDGKIETGSKEHAGVVHNAIQRAKGGKPDGKDTRKEEVVNEKDGLWDNIHQKRKRMKAGSGEKKAKPGDKDYPKTLNVEGMKQARKNVGADTCWDGYKAKGTKKKNGREVPNCVKEEEIDEGSMKQARKNVGADTCWDGYKAKGTKMKNGRVVPNCVKEEDTEVNHIDGSRTQIIDIVKAPKMPSAAEISEMDGSKLGIGLATGVIGGGLTLMKKAAETANSLKKKMQQRTKVEGYSNWREDFIWEGPATAKDPKLDVKETGVKNKIEVNPEVKTEEKKKSSSYSSII